MKKLMLIKFGKYELLESVFWFEPVNQVCWYPWVNMFVMMNIFVCRI